MLLDHIYYKLYTRVFLFTITFLLLFQGANAQTSTFCSTIKPFLNQNLINQTSQSLASVLSSTSSDSDKRDIIIYKYCNFYDSGRPSSSITANGLKDVTIRLGESVNFQWSAPQSFNVTATYSSQNPSCGILIGPHQADFILQNKLGGTSLQSFSNPCQVGQIYTYSYTAYDEFGNQSVSQVVVRVKSGDAKYTTANPLRIAMYGDSTVFGSMFNGTAYVQSPYNVPKTLNKMLQDALGTSVVVEDKSVPGSTCPEWLWGKGLVHKSWDKEMSDTNAQMVLMNVGINDAYIPLSSISYDDYRFCYEQIASIAASKGRAFIFETPNLITSDHSSELWSRMHIEKIVQTLFPSSILIDQFKYTSDLGWIKWDSLLTDKIHPGNEGYIYKSQKSFEVLYPILTDKLK